MEIKATSKNNAATVKRLQRVAFRVANGHVIFCAGGILILLMLLVHLIVSKGFKHFFLGYLILLAVWLGTYAYSYFIVPRRAYRKDKRIRKAENAITFSDNAVTVISTTDTSFEKQVVPYEEVYRMCEDPTHFYIFISPEIGYTVDKSSMKGGTETVLRRKLFGYFGQKRYILFNKDVTED
ncbi:MAG: YcxB family protein [Clostridia bacterium]|nr:YcxB family protein [Clostridia bacterium]